MLFFEVFVPNGTLTPERRGHIGERLVAAVVDAGDAPPAAQETARAMRAMSWVAFHELDSWFVDGRRVARGEAPRYLVRVTVTAGALSEAKRAHVIERVTQVLAEVDDDPRRMCQSPDAWVHLVEVPDGGWGALGRVMGHADVVELIRSSSVAVRAASGGAA
jgi:phenylpyruvate tautomerase PptA (4-oxalocrotonate tautomerase family)